MGFQDVFKKSFLEGFTSMDISAGRIMATFAVTCILACYVFLIYRLMTRKSFYSKGFNVSLAALSVITAAIILAMQSNLVISLGMVGALSIVRFRAAIKEPIEIVYLFWSIASGIVIGAGLIPLAVIGSAIIGIILILFANRKVHENPYILILNCVDERSEEEVLAMAQKSVKKFMVKSKTVNASGIELTAEIRLRDAATSFVNRFHDIDGVSNVTLVSYNGEYMS